jgi:predicted porin
MKKSLLALAVLGALTTAASAQSNVTVYGVVDMGLSLERGSAAGSVNKLTSGIGSGSRLGFKGTEDLGGGLTALFTLENGFLADTGGIAQSGQLFGRQAWVGLGSRFGTVTLGRQYAPHYLTTVFADPFSSGFAGDSKNLIQAVGTAGGRMDNSVKYATPTVNGFSGEAAYVAGEVAGDNSAGRQFGAAVGYAAGPFAVRAAYHNRNNDTALVQSDSTRNSLLAATYDFEVAKVFAAYGVNKGPFSSPLRNANNPYNFTVAPTARSITDDSNDVLVGVTVPVGAGTVMASYIRKDDKTGANRDADQWAFGYRYALSKRTTLYTTYARIENDNGAAYTVGNATEGGTGDKTLNIGIRHTF